MITVKDFCEKFKKDGVINTKIAPDAVSEYIKKELEVKTYLPFMTKREIIEMVVNANITMVDGVKKYDNIRGYVAFIVAMIQAHTNIEFNTENPMPDYDMLAESKLLQQIVETFREDYDECDVLLKMALAAEMEDNNGKAILGRFLNSVLERLDGVIEIISEAAGELDLKSMLGDNFNAENLAKLSSFLDKYEK